jgi:hypothetical protein
MYRDFESVSGARSAGSSGCRRRRRHRLVRRRRPQQRERLEVQTQVAHIFG